MARTILISALTALVIAVAVAAFTHQAAPEPAPAPTAPPDGTAELLARLEAIEKRIADLASQPPAPSLDEGPEAARATPDPTHWITRLAEEDVNVAFKATIELGKLGDSRAVPPLMQALQTHPDMYVRIGAAAALGDLDVVAAVPALIESLDDREPLVRTAAQDALVSLTGRKATHQADAPAEEQAAGQESWRQWWRQRGVSQQEADTDTAAPPTAEFEQWVEQLRDESEEAAFKATLELGNLGDVRAAGPLVVVLQTHDSYYVRLAAATALGELGVVDTLPALIDALTDQDSLVRTAAHDALTTITGAKIDYTADAETGEEREAGQARWRAWWEENKD